MTASLLSAFRNTGPPIANHLWQSTLFVAAIGLLTPLFGSNHARVRFRLWLAASAKFLIPFSALIALGSVIPASNHAAPVWQPSLISAVHVVDQPFSTETITRVANPLTLSQRAKAWLPAALVLIWAMGFAAVLLAWYARRRQIANVLRKAIPVEARRELEILRRIENDTTARTRTRFLISNELMEPGVFGIFRPVLLWPAHLSDRLEDAHLQAILAHEVAHVHRRDNLAAAIHMAVEAIFWFHPFVWWIERKLVEERERACDEAVVQSGSGAEIYADSLVKVSRFCAELPLPCVSGITGADLSKRIRFIMLHRFSDLGIGKRLMLAAFALGAVGVPFAFGLMEQAPQGSQILHATGPLPSFEVASIKPNHSGSRFAATGAGVLSGPRGPAIPKDRFIATNITIKQLILWAWAPGTTRPLPEDQLVGGPGWVNSDRYDIDAKLADSQVAALEKLDSWDRSVQVKLMVHSLLADRFKLVLNDGATAPRPAYALVIAQGGPKLRPTAPCSFPPPDAPPMPPPPPPPPGGFPTAPQTPATMPQVRVMFVRPGEMIACGNPMSDLARELQGELGRPVLDETGLKGNYSFDLKWTPDLNKPRAMPGQSPGAEAALPDTSGPSIFTAVQEQLGLKLESRKSTEEAIAIVHIQKPSEN
ncbi:MAG TPA: M56 family metallopeptidase [Terracidiphilus sp.]|nr:M56 family metallopeptidase [Terracidiphilus sp.]